MMVLFRGSTFVGDVLHPFMVRFHKLTNGFDGCSRGIGDEETSRIAVAELDPFILRVRSILAIEAGMNCQIVVQDSALMIF